MRGLIGERSAWSQRPVTDRRQLFDLHLERLAGLRTDPREVEGEFLGTKFQILGLSSLAAVGSDRTLQEEGKGLRVLRRVDQEVAALLGTIADGDDTIESRRLVEIGDHLVAGGINPGPLRPAAAGPNHFSRAHTRS